MTEQQSQFGENLEKAIIREYYEETGATIEVERLALALKISLFSTQDNGMRFFFLYSKDENGEQDIFEGERVIKDNSDGIFQVL